MTEKFDIELEAHMKKYVKYAVKYEKWSDLKFTLTDLVKSSRWTIIRRLISRINRDKFFCIIRSFSPKTALSNEISFHFHIGDIFGTALILDAVVTSYVNRHSNLDFKFLKQLGAMIGLCIETFSPFKLKEYAITNLKVSSDQFNKALGPTIAKFITKYNPLPRVAFICECLYQSKSTIFHENDDDWSRYCRTLEFTNSNLIKRLAILIEFPWHIAHFYNLAAIAFQNIKAHPRITDHIVELLSKYHTIISNDQYRKVYMQIELERNSGIKNEIVVQKKIDEYLNKKNKKYDYSSIPNICMRSGRQLSNPVDFENVLTCSQCQCYVEAIKPVYNQICPVCMKTFTAT